MTIKVSIIIPVVHTWKAERCVDAIQKNAGIPKDEYEIIQKIDLHGIGCPKMINLLGHQTKGGMVCFLGEDTIPQKDFLKNAIAAMESIPDGYGMVSFNDNPTTTLSAAHWLLHKKMLPFLDNNYVWEGYKHSFCDDELLIRCQSMGRYIYAYNAILIHDHPIFKGDQKKAIGARITDDPEYAKAYSSYEEDQAEFNRRMATNWDTQTEKNGLKVLVACPSNDLVHADFAMSLVNMCVYSSLKGIRVFLFNPQMTVIELARCEMAGIAEQLKTDYLLTIDSDMTFPKELLVRLINHQQAIVCTDASTRRGQIQNVVRDLDGKALDHSVKRDCDLMEISRGTSAVQLVKTSVFSKLPKPPYRVHVNEKGQFLGEDYYFSDLAREHGFKIYCDMVLSKQIGHIGVQTFTVQ